MKDIPFFTTDYGVASLMLAEIRYRQEAYIRVQSVHDGAVEDLIRECMAFCRAAGAEKVYWSAGEVEGELHTSIYEMRGVAWVDPAKLANLFPVTEETVTRWRQIFNERMIQVDNAATLTSHDEKRILASGGAYFIHHDGELLGVGWMEDAKLQAIAAVKPGAGERVLHSLMSLVEGETVTLEVASTNEKAIRLYERVGFVKTREIRRWYRA